MAFQTEAFQNNAFQVEPQPPVQSRPEYDAYGLALPAETPGQAPRIGSPDKLQADRDFWALARLQEISEYLEDVEEWALAADIGEEDEVVDLMEMTGLEADEELFGKVRSVRRGRRKPR